MGVIIRNMDKKNILRLIIGFLILFLSVLSWYLLKNSFDQAQGGEWVTGVLWPSLSLIALGSFIGLFYLIESDWRVLSGALLLVVAPFFVFFDSLNWEKLIVIGAMFFFLWRGIHRSRREKKEKIKLSLAEILLKGLAPTVTALTLLAAIGFYGSPYAQSLGQAEIVIPRDMFNRIISPLLNAPSALKNLTGGQPESAKNDNEQLKSALYQEINKYMNTVGNPYKRFLPFGLTTTFFFAMRIWGVVLMRLAAILAWGWFSLLRLLKLARIGKINIEKEIITL